MSVAVVQVKICGITRLEDAQAAVESGADLLGFNFYPQSSRYIAPERAQRIIATLSGTARSVGVFVNAELATVRRIADICHLDYVQLHGDETPDFVSACTPFAFKALRPRSVAEAEAGAALYAHLGPDDAAAPALLLDAYHPMSYGGTGQQGDWRIAVRLASRYRILLAGGLTPENVAEVIHRVHPWGVDVASGVEDVTGIKNHDKVQQFIQETKVAGAYEI
jgi:phosphoribosylanthranilate isomerase